MHVEVLPLSKAVVVELNLHWVAESAAIDERCC